MCACMCRWEHMWPWPPPLPLSTLPGSVHMCVRVTRWWLCDGGDSGSVGCQQQYWVTLDDLSRSLARHLLLPATRARCHQLTVSTLPLPPRPVTR